MSRRKRKAKKPRHGVRNTYYRSGSLITTAPGGEIRCLGPIEPEHTFLSPDRVRVRYCPKCRARVAQISQDHSPNGIREHKDHSR